ncbi:Phosphatidylglycerol--prolipoprotein diacylglyceryl transferase [subsurface metagenome]
MYRILFTIGSFPIYSYGVMIALAFITAILFAMKEAKRIGENPERILDVSLYIILGTIIGGRLGYVIFHIDYYLKNPIEILYFRQGGLSFLGGFLIAFFLCWLYFKRTKISFWKYAVRKIWTQVSCFEYASCLFTAIKRWINYLRKFLYSSCNPYTTLFFFIWLSNIFCTSLDEKI